MASQGSTGNVIAALCSFFIPGLGQLVQGRLLAAIFYFVTCGVLYCFAWTGIGLLLGALVHLIGIISAALFKP